MTRMKGFFLGLGITEFGLLVLLLAAILVIFLFFSGILESFGEGVPRMIADWFGWLGG